jgi:hypothetical protein
MPCNASGCSWREVRAEMNDSSGASLFSTRPVVMANSFCQPSGSRRSQVISSAHSAS